MHSEKNLKKNSENEYENKLMTRYFKEVYSKRDTVSKASDYSWQPFSLAEATELGAKIKSASNPEKYRSDND